MSLGSFLRRLFRSQPTTNSDDCPPPTSAAPPQPAASPEVPPPPPPPDLAAQIDALGADTDPIHSLVLQARGTPQERSALAAVWRCCERCRLPEPTVLLCADILVERGDRQTAIRFLRDTSSPQALLFSADLSFDSGDVPTALSKVERVLAVDIDFPGARERHAQWRRCIQTAERARGTADVTMAVPTTNLGPYRIIREVARGGSGTIYEARDDQLDRIVAYKVYHRANADADQIRREVTTASRLAGPGVIRVFDVDARHGWIALEWIALGSLRSILRTGPIDTLTPLARWALPLAKAISRVHQAGWVHADIKPANILLRSPHDPVLADFGIAVVFASPTLGGSTGYLSPERLAGQPLVASDDVYAFGRVIEDVMAKVGEEPTWREIAAECLRGAADRPSDGAALIARIESALPRIRA